MKMSQLGRKINLKRAHSRFDNVVSTGSAPFDISRVTLSVHSDGFSVDDKFAILSLNSSFESSVDGIKLEHVDLQSFREKRSTSGM